MADKVIPLITKYSKFGAFIFACKQAGVRRIRQGTTGFILSDDEVKVEYTAVVADSNSLNILRFFKITTAAAYARDAELVYQFLVEEGFVVARGSWNEQSALAYYSVWKHIHDSQEVGETLFEPR